MPGTAPVAKGHGNEQDTTGVLWPSSKHQTPTEGAGDLTRCGGDAENTSAVGTLSGRVPAFQGRAGKRCKDHFSKRSWPHPTWGSLLTPSPLRHGPPGSCGLTSQPLTSGSFRGARTEETGTELAMALLESRLFTEEKGQTEPTPTPAPASRSPGPIWTPGCPRRPEVPRSGRGSITEPGFWATFPGAEPALGTATPRPRVCVPLSKRSVAGRACGDTQGHADALCPTLASVPKSLAALPTPSICECGLIGVSQGIESRRDQWSGHMST